MPPRKHGPRQNSAPAKHRNGETAAADCHAVTAAAKALGLREYDYFRLAYRRWFGRLPAESVLEAAFSRYMFAEDVPPWARHLSRDVLDRRRHGILGEDAFGAERFRDRPSRPRNGPLYFGVVVVLWLVLFGVILNTRYDPRTSAPAPVCATETGSYFYEYWARLIAGEPPPRCQRGEWRR